MTQHSHITASNGLDYDRTLILAVEVSGRSWVVAAQVPGLRQKSAKQQLAPGPTRSWLRSRATSVVRPRPAWWWSGSSSPTSPAGAASGSRAGRRSAAGGGVGGGGWSGGGPRG